MRRSPPKTFADHLRDRIRKLHCAFVAVQACANMDMHRDGNGLALIRTHAANGELETLALERDIIQVFALTKPAPRVEYDRRAKRARAASVSDPVQQARFRDGARP